MIIDISKLEGVKQKGGGNIIARCPACAAENSDSTFSHLSILPDGKFNCIKFSNDTAHNKLILQLAGIDSDNKDNNFTQEVEEKVELPKRWPLSTLERLVKSYDYWEKRGIPAEVVEKFGGGIATSGQFLNRFVIPIFNQEKTEIIGFTGRSLNDKGPKWLHSKGKKAEWIWSPDINAIREKGYILIIESPSDGFRLAEYGYMNFMAVFGTTISDYQLSYLISVSPPKILIGLNNEPENANIGNHAAERMRNKLIKFFNEDKVIIALPPKKDFEMLSQEEMTEYDHNYSQSFYKLL